MTDFLYWHISNFNEHVIRSLSRSLSRVVYPCPEFPIPVIRLSGNSWTESQSLDLELIIPWFADKKAQVLLPIIYWETTQVDFWVDFGILAKKMFTGRSLHSIQRYENDFLFVSHKIWTNHTESAYTIFLPYFMCRINFSCYLKFFFSKYATKINCPRKWSIRKGGGLNPNWAVISKDANRLLFVEKTVQNQLSLSTKIIQQLWSSTFMTVYF